MRKEGLRRLLGGSSLLDVLVLKADGDCFYEGVARALNDGTTIAALRSLVADTVTQDMFESYKACSVVDGFDWVIRCGDLHDLKLAIQESKRVWADENALSSVAGTLVRLLILDEEGLVHASKYVNKGFTEAAEADRLPIILLTRSRRQHYNAATWSGSLVFATSVDELPPEIHQLFFPSSSPPEDAQKQKDNVAGRKRGRGH